MFLGIESTNVNTTVRNGWFDVLVEVFCYEIETSSAHGKKIMLFVKFTQLNVIDDFGCHKC